MISEEQVRHVANLARLGLTDEEVEKIGILYVIDLGCGDLLCNPLSPAITV